MVWNNESFPNKLSKLSNSNNQHVVLQVSTLQERQELSVRPIQEVHLCPSRTWRQDAGSSGTPRNPDAVPAGPGPEEDQAVLQLPRLQVRRAVLVHSPERLGSRLPEQAQARTLGCLGQFVRKGAAGSQDAVPAEPRQDEDGAVRQVPELQVCGAVLLHSPRRDKREALQLGGARRSYAQAGHPR
jgi:hypothetical protein